jgi:predicted O-linked N-acetylglucosamine transferase (SPINDLY family)
MGVPVLTITGDRHAGRVGETLLKCIGLDDWVADSTEQFVTRATGYAADLIGLANMRSGLRERMAASPLCDSDAFASKVETAYRDMWCRWCDSGDT